MQPKYRDWNRDLSAGWLDLGIFARHLPPLPQRVLDQIRPLAPDYATWVWERVFAGIEYPFHPKKARGWMKQILTRARSKSSDTKPRLTELESLRVQMGWDLEDKVFFLYQPDYGYQAKWSVGLGHLDRLLGYVDTGIICHLSNRNVAVFWEGFGPYFGKRGDRSLIHAGA